MARAICTLRRYRVGRDSLRAWACRRAPRRTHNPNGGLECGTCTCRLGLAYCRAGSQKVYQ